MHFIGYFPRECENTLEPYRRYMLSKVHAHTHIHVHIYLQEQNMRYLFKFSWSFLYGVYANCLALAILTLEVSHDRSSILQR